MNRDLQMLPVLALEPHVIKVDRFEMAVTLRKKSVLSHSLQLGRHALLRRWDQKKDLTAEGVLTITESDDLNQGWIEIENGIKIQFQPGSAYRTGDYWLIPARTSLGDVDWPQDNTGPEFTPPRGVLHHLAPLAIISVGNGAVTLKYDCRCRFKPFTYSCPYSYYGQLGIGVDLLCPE